MKVLADYDENPFDLSSEEIIFADSFERWKKLKYKDKEMSAEYKANYKKLAPLYNMRLTKKLWQLILRHWLNFRQNICRMTVGILVQKC